MNGRALDTVLPEYRPTYAIVSLIRRVRGLCPRVLTAFAFVLLAQCLANTASAQAISRSARFTGNINFIATGGSLRAEANTGNECARVTSSSRTLSGIPANSTILAAYLYWSGSGTSVDANVRLNGTNVAASRTFTTTYPANNTTYAFFGGFANVSNIVTSVGNGTYTFSNLTFSTGDPWCGFGVVEGGWGLIVIYSNPTERLRAVNVFDGLQYFRGSSVTLTPNGFRVPPLNVDGKMAIVAWEGDPQNSGPMNGFTESLTFNGTALNDGIAVPNSDPEPQPYDGTVNTANVANSHGVDVDTFNISSLVPAGATSATTVFSSGGDFVLLAAQVVSITTDPAVDLSITKTHTGNFTVGTNGVYTITVSNTAGFETEDNVVTVTDTLPAGLTFVSGTGTGWTCSANAQVVTCTHAPPLATGASLPAITLTVAVTPTVAASVTNTAMVDSASIDTITTNDSASDLTTIVRIGPALSVQKISQVLTDPINGASLPKRIPGAVIRYEVKVTNGGSGAPDSGSLVITDPVPVGTSLYVATIAGNPIEFVNGTPASGLTFNYATHVTYSNQPGGGAPFNYTPVPDLQGFDASVTGFRVAPAGTMGIFSTAGAPSFTLRFQVRVK